MTTQANLNTSLTVLSQALTRNQDKIEVSTFEYWNELLTKKYTLHSNKTVQSTMPNPLAYFVVPLAGDGKRGRSHEFTISQFEFALMQGWTASADVKLRGVNKEAIKAGKSWSRPRGNSKYGSMVGRQLAAQTSDMAMSKKDKDTLAEAVLRVEKAPTAIIAISNIAQVRSGLDGIKERAARRLARTAPPVVPAVNDKTGEV